MPCFCDIFAQCLSCSEKRQKIKACFKAFSWSFWPLKAWTAWVNRAFTTWVNRAFTTRVNRASTPWVNRAFTRWVHWLSLSQWTGCHPKRGLFVHFPLLFSKKSRHFSKVKMQAQTIVLLLNDNSWTLDNPWGGAYGCNPKSVAVYPYTWCSLWAAAYLQKHSWLISSKSKSVS